MEVYPSSFSTTDGNSRSYPPALHLTESEELQQWSKALSSLKIPCDGEPPRELELPDETCWGSDDELVPEFEIAKKTTGVRAKDVRIIALDLYGVLTVSTFSTIALL